MVVDRDALGADMLLCSAYKFFGPHVGVATLRREVFESLDMYKLEPAPSSIPDKLETGTQNHAGIAGVGAAISYLSTLGQGTTLHESSFPPSISSRRTRMRWRGACGKGCRTCPA